MYIYTKTSQFIASMRYTSGVCSSLSFEKADRDDAVRSKFCFGEILETSENDSRGSST